MSIEAFWHGSARQFLATTRTALTERLTAEQARRFRRFETTQRRAWDEQIALLTDVLRTSPDATDWYILLEASLPRTPRRADAVVLAGATIIVLEFKIGCEHFSAADRMQAEDFALDLQAFHAGSHHARIVPILVATGVRMVKPAQRGLGFGIVAGVIDTNAQMLGEEIRLCLAQPSPAIDPAHWMAAPYRPVPPIISAACALYSRHRVDDILDARAGALSLKMTSDAIHTALTEARDSGQFLILFVTGVPGAGKTLCGLNACFGASTDDVRATFLTGNPSLVHVLREALVRDAVRQGAARGDAKRKMQGVIQSLPRFRDKYVAQRETPPERVVVIDEAQRSWTAEYAIRKSRDRTPPLTASEPAHLLDAMARHARWAAIICLVGNGQEIHDGEGGLREWGEALSARPLWRVVAAPDCLQAAEARRRLQKLPGLQTNQHLHLTVPTRQIGAPQAIDWVEAVLRGDAQEAADLAGQMPQLPYFLTRDARDLRLLVRALARGSRRAGLVASSGGKRLRADGLGSELPHLDEDAVARWFLDCWPDVRSSGALETVATEFSVQGLELDVVGLCWDGDLIRVPGRQDWQARRFAGTAWQTLGRAEKVANRLNSYRVLLTRARHATVIYVPGGDADDCTRAPEIYQRIAGFLADCGVRAMPQAQPHGGLPAATKGVSLNF